MSSAALGCTTISELPPELLRSEILPLCAEYAPALRAVCRLWHAAAAALRREAEPKGCGLSFLAERGHAELIEWVRQLRGAGLEGAETHPYHSFTKPQLEKMLAGACAGGHLTLAKQMYAWGAALRTETLGPLAARGGHAALINWMEECQPHCVEYIYMLDPAAQGGHFDLVKELHSKICLCEKGRLIGQTSRSTLVETPISHRIHTGTMVGAARGGHVNIMEFAFSLGADIAPGCLFDAAKGNHTAAVDWLLSKNSSRDAIREGCEGAVTGGHISLLERLWQDPTILNREPALELIAAINGHLHVVKWLAGRLAPKFSYDLVLRGAVEGGHVAICTFALEHGANPLLGGLVSFDTSNVDVTALRQLFELRASVLEKDGKVPALSQRRLQDMLYFALNAKRIETARWLIEEFGLVSALEEHMSVNIHGGDLNTLKALKKLGDDFPAHRVNYAELLVDAVECGEEDMMELLKQWAGDVPLEYFTMFRGARVRAQLGALWRLKRWCPSHTLRELDFLRAGEIDARLAARGVDASRASAEMIEACLAALAPYETQEADGPASYAEYFT